MTDSDPTDDAPAGGAGPAVEAADEPAVEGDDRRIGADPERAALLRSVAEEVRGDSGESKQVAAILYRVSDLYDPEEETTPEAIYRNVRTIFQVREAGGIEREHD